MIRASLSRAVESADPHEWPKFVRNTIRRIEMVIERVDTTVPAQIGQKSGTNTPERRTGYTRQIPVVRKIRAGRPKKQSTSNQI